MQHVGVGAVTSRFSAVRQLFAASYNYIEMSVLCHKEDMLEAKVRVVLRSIAFSGETQLRVSLLRLR